ncbi:MAG TPA: hypothetical protein VLA50_04140 [Erythrobacter sp.]|nr:hypothetical protein [Erythrobacter sp.]
MSGQKVRYFAALALMLCAGCQDEPAEQTYSERLEEVEANIASSRPPGQPAVRIAMGPPVYECEFKSHGTIVIDTNPRDTRIIINGLSIPAGSGSYFYQSTDGSEVVFFGPEMSYWEYKGERAENCVIR